VKREDEDCAIIATFSVVKSQKEVGDVEALHQQKNLVKK